MKKRKIKIFAAAVVFVIAVFLLTDAYLIFLKPLDIGAPVDPAYGDVILVLGGGLKKGRTLGYSTEERLDLAVGLFKQKPRTIIISGGSLYRGSPAIDKIKVYFAAHGVGEKYLRFEGKSQTTYDNFYYSNRMITDMKFGEVIVSTSPYHQRRSRMILSHLGFVNYRMAGMAVSEIYQAGGIGQRLRNMKLIAREYLAIIKFKIFKK